MKIFVNGVSEELVGGLAELVSRYENKNIAVAVNEVLVKKSDIGTFVLKAKDRVDILTIAEGG